jgi:aspartyl-tRNA(Asn)/glutamyl-tRNA(Gln) amidotransferase subunit B
MKKYEVVIGLEIHAQLLTESKIFCGCSTKFGNPPNTNICPVCTGQPGVLPVLNKKVVEFALKTGIALNGHIAPYSIFARKNYFYPDLPKNYQVSQFELPIVGKGHLDVLVNGETKRVGITRVHLEEDAGKLVHQGSSGLKGSTGSHVDFNRTGVPLMEIVTEPDIRSPEEAKVFMQDLRTLLVYLGVCDGNMEEGSLRCDANVSLRPVGQKEFGTKTEVKNMNSFKAVYYALESEIERQTQVLNEGGRIVQESRLYEEATGKTSTMRSKEEAHDYRYFPEPDLVPVEPDPKWIEQIRASIGELPQAKRNRYVKELGLTAQDAEVLTSDKNMAKLFEDSVVLINDPKEICNWVLGDLLAFSNDKKVNIFTDISVPAKLAEVIKNMKSGAISRKTAKEVLIKALDTDKTVSDIIKDSGLTQISNEDEIIKIVREVVAANPGPVAQYKAGKTTVAAFFVGQVMKTTKGRANPDAVNRLVAAELSK